MQCEQQITDANIIQTEYIPDRTFPGLKISISTLKNALCQRSMSEKTAAQIAGAFSGYLGDTDQHKITKEDLYLSFPAFRGKYPPEVFAADSAERENANLSLFTNTLFRCYYMLSRSPHYANYGLLKLFEVNGKLTACMVREISSYDEVRDLINNFDSYENLVRCFRARKQDNLFRMGYLYTAGPEDITYSSECIQIHFTSVERNPCHCSLTWNISIASKLRHATYTGGTALVVDTNDGKRAKEISAFKMGLEAVNAKEEAAGFSRGLWEKDSAQLITELAPALKNGSIIVDATDDNRWYHFIVDSRQAGKSRENTPKGELYDLIRELRTLRNEYARELEQLKHYTDTKGNE